MSIEWRQVAISGVAAVAMPLIILGLSKAFPSKSSAIPTENEFSNKEVLKWNRIILPISFVFAILSGGVFWLLITFLYSIYRSSLEPTEIFVGSPVGTFALPALFVGLIVGSQFSKTITRVLLKDRYELYIGASNRQYGGMNSEKILKGLNALFAVLILSSTIELFHLKIMVFNDRLTACGLVSCDTYPFQDFTEIAQSSHARAPNGSIVLRQDLYFRFKDGTFWSPNLLSGDPIQNKVVSFLSEKTGLKVKYVEMLPEN